MLDKDGIYDVPSCRGQRRQREKSRKNSVDPLPSFCAGAMQTAQIQRPQPSPNFVTDTAASRRILPLKDVVQRQPRRAKL
ncbi:hypothetical protein LMH87_005913 [Akanthomyces muscarius]|uniref:Uncharacterized protein n=1 Tax=Akanthomyces muscarius TaxID=2231603 RepID=A0A9W8USC4_AKAMU|nr:hypothetical protein LMH87_005913 [Akanthomyces muscarius]KAJ4164230.1 hypothetical protein LMH87_005913 [Akanthomyces muscarius]